MFSYDFRVVKVFYMICYNFAWELFCFENKIGDIGAKYFGLALSKLNKLTYLYFRINNLFIFVYLFLYLLKE